MNLLLLFSLLTFTACEEMSSQRNSNGLSNMGSDLSAQPLFNYNGKVIRLADLPKKYQFAIIEAQKSAQRETLNTVKSYIAEDYLNHLAKLNNTSVEDTRAKKLDVASPTEQEIKAFYEERKDRIPYEYKVVKSELAKIMMNDRKAAAHRKLAEAAETEGNFRPLLPHLQEPTVVINGSAYPRKGSEDPQAVEVVLFSDLNCQYCIRIANQWETLLTEKYQAKVRSIYIERPPSSKLGNKEPIDFAKLAYCTHKQGKYWELYQFAISKSNVASKDDVENFLIKAKLDKDGQFKACLSDSTTTEFINATNMVIEDAGVTLYPVFYVNGIRVLADFELNSLQDRIKRELKKASAKE